ncbi:MAG: glycyl-radical enzyme activating protein, partial [Bilophila wadsworthia]
GLNDDEGHLENFARTIKALGRVQAVELLPYHRLGKNKYALLGRAYALESLGPMSKEDLARRAAFVAERLGGTKVLF